VSYTVQTPVFEGPFDLLLHLILREQVELYEVSLASIVDAYITEMERMEALDLEVATEFLLIASTLVELKTRRLLPDDSDLDLDEELGLWEERDLLLSRLLECKTFKDAARTIQTLHNAASLSQPRTCGPDERFVSLAADPLEGVNPDRLRKAFLRAMQPRPKSHIDLFHVAPIRISVMDAVEDLCSELPRRRTATFRELTEGLTDRIEVIVNFLAILELFKQGLVSLEQARTFGDIQVVWLAGDSVGAEALELVDTYDG
jgi:segregation and condensation protein A